MLGNNSDWFLLKQKDYVSTDGSGRGGWYVANRMSEENSKVAEKLVKRPSELLAFREFSANNAEQTSYALSFRTSVSCATKGRLKKWAVILHMLEKSRTDQIRNILV